MRGKKKTLIAIVFVIVLVIGIQRLGWFDFLGNGFRSIGMMVARPFYHMRISMHEFFQKRKLKDTWYVEWEHAQKQLQLNMVDRGALALLQDENKQMKEQLNFFSFHLSFSHVGAEVVSRTVDPLGTTVIINKGTEYGIKVGNPVIVNDGILVGLVLHTYNHSSVVRLLSDSESKIGATAMNEEKSIGLVEGGYGLGIRMNYIPQNEIITPGTIIMTSGLTEDVPRGLVMGIVEVVEKQPHEPFQQAVLKSAADLSHITLVSVITSTEL